MATLPRSWILGAVAAAALTPAAAFAQQLSDTRIAFQTDRDGPGNLPDAPRRLGTGEHHRHAHG